MSKLFRKTLFGGEHSFVMELPLSYAHAKIDYTYVDKSRQYLQKMKYYSDCLYCDMVFGLFPRNAEKMVFDNQIEQTFGTVFDTR